MHTLLLVLLATMSFAAPKPDPKTLLQASDRSRGAVAALKGLSWTAKVDSTEDGKQRTVVYALKVLKNDALAKVIEPARQKDEIILFNDRNLWFFKPGLRKPVSISARQKLVGQAANDDIASTNYARDYEATSITEDQLNGEDYWKLELKAVATDVTYDRIRYWVSKDKMLAAKAEFLTVSGQVFKVAAFLYKNSVSLNGKSYPFVSKMRIQDAHNKLNVTTIDYQEPREETHPPAIFNVNNLIK